MSNGDFPKPDWQKPDWRIVARSSGLNQPTDSSARTFVSLGWHPDVPDRRDQNIKTDHIQESLKKLKSSIVSRRKIAVQCDHRNFCSPVEDQGVLGSCTAQAVVGLMEYMMCRSTGNHVDGSRLFVYKVTRKLLGWKGDTGAYLRTAMKAVATFGVPPEQYWPYDISKYEEEPTSFLYSFASNYQSLDYTRLDPAGTAPSQALDNIKRVLAAGFPVVFGFSVYSSLSAAANIPFPSKNDALEGGHAVMAVGYDDEHKITVTADNGTTRETTEPSIIIRNSWGPGWGEQGYGYLPARYITEGLAQDFWTVFKWEWLKTKQFD